MSTPSIDVDRPADAPPPHVVETAPPTAVAQLAAGESARFARIIGATRDLLGVDAAGVEVLDLRGRWSSSGIGTAAFDSTAVHGMCDRAMGLGGQLVVEDLAAEPEHAAEGCADMRFFAAYPLTDLTSGATGVLWVSSTAPRTFSDTDRERLRDFAAWFSDEAVAAEELLRSRQVQQALLPTSFDTLDGYEVAGASAPRRAVGGDFYDWYPVQDGAAFTLGDVMGKGLPAALIASTVRAVMRAGSRWGGVASAAEAAEETLDADLNGASTFVTLFHAYLDEETGVVRYIDAGHGLSLVVHADGSCERLSSAALPLGAGANTEWLAQSVRLLEGSTLVSVSDGVLDLFDGTLAALDEVEAIVRTAPSAQAVVDALMGRIDSAVPDDVTVIAIRRDTGDSDWD